MNKSTIQNWNELEDRKPVYALVAGVDMIVVRLHISDLITFKNDVAELTSVE